MHTPTTLVTAAGHAPAPPDHPCPPSTLQCKPPLPLETSVSTSQSPDSRLALRARVPARRATSTRCCVSGCTPAQPLRTTHLLARSASRTPAAAPPLAPSAVLLCPRRVDARHCANLVAVHSRSLHLPLLPLLCSLRHLACAAGGARSTCTPFYSCRAHGRPAKRCRAQAEGAACGGCAAVAMLQV